MTDERLQGTSNRIAELIIDEDPDWDASKSALADRLNIYFEAMTARQQSEFLAAFEDLIFGADS